MSNSRPADFYIDGAGKAKRDFCVDVVITDERNARRSTTSPIEQERRAQSAGRAARMMRAGEAPAPPGAATSIPSAALQAAPPYVFPDRRTDDQPTGTWPPRDAPKATSGEAAPK